MNDLRLVMRQWMKQPGFLAVATFTLALGVGVNLALISLANGMFLRPMPGLREVDTLMTLARVYPGGLAVNAHISYPHFREFRESQTAFSELAAFAAAPFNIAGRERGDRVMGEMVTANYLRTLGVPLLLGRDFRADEDEVPGRDPVVILSERLWRERWGADAAIVGSRVVINTNTFTVIGVAGGGFRGYQLPTGYDLWMPLSMASQVQGGSANRYSDSSLNWIHRSVGRLKPGITWRDAEAQVEVMAARAVAGVGTGEELSTPRWRGAPYSPFPSFNQRGPLMFVGVLTGLTTLVLLVVCANVAALFLARALRRQREAAIRLALGSTRTRLMRLAFLEGAVVGVLGVVVGMVFAVRAANWLVGWIPGDGGEPMVLRSVLDWRLATVALVLALMSTVGVSLLPAWRLARVRVAPVLKAAEGASTGRRSRSRSVLTTLQIACSLVLVIVAALLYRGLATLQRVDPGMRLDGLLVARVDLGLNGMRDAAVDRFVRDLSERLDSVPGVEAVALAEHAPLAIGTSTVRVGAETHEGAASATLFWNAVSPGYLRTIGARVVHGREFEPGDLREGQAVAIVNEELANRLWPGQNAVGQWLYQNDRPDRPRLVVGVVRVAVYGDAAEASRRTPPPYLYVPLAQSEAQALSILVRTPGAPMFLLPEVRRAVAAVDSEVPVFQPTTLRTMHDESFWQQRLAGVLVASSGGLALLLAMLGLYSAMAQEVDRRRREIGVRLAVGATVRDVLQLLVRQGLRLMSMGAVLGLLLGWGLTRALSGFLPGVSSTDPVAFGLGVTVLTALAWLATWSAARRVTRITPVEVLRADG
ncbi:MAG: ABC transporter permease [Verrucomicrobiales bacterium]|nr:ABC transporter permease [Verrucomicrobiales bacterium]